MFYRTYAFQKMAEESVKPRLEKAHIEYCPVCDVPLCYCKFFKLHGAQSLDEDGVANGEALLDEEKKPEAEKKEKKGSQKELPKIQIVVKNRRARKYTTSVSMIEPYGLDLKEVQKAISKKMSTAASTKKKNGMTQIVIQGDAGTTVRDILKNQFKIPITSIQVIIKQPKKPEPKQPPPQGKFDDEDDE